MCIHESFIVQKICIEMSFCNNSELLYTLCKPVLVINIYIYYIYVEQKQIVANINQVSHLLYNN